MNLLIVGSARCVWDDLEKLRLSGKYVMQPSAFNVMTVNDMVMHFPWPVDHAYSNDAGMLENWIEARRDTLPSFEGISHSCNKGADVLWPWNGQGTSGLGAVRTGLHIEPLYEKIILCGIPLDNSGHYFDPPWVTSNFTTEVPLDGDELRYWKGIDKSRVRSMSGRTREYFGAP